MQATQRCRAFGFSVSQLRSDGLCFSVRLLDVGFSPITLGKALQQSANHGHMVRSRQSSGSNKEHSVCYTVDVALVHGSGPNLMLGHHMLDWGVVPP